ncbi:MAG: iron-containing redox enzyme family protein [Pseudobdellovibrionaceae bacterium]
METNVICKACCNDLNEEQKSLIQIWKNMVESSYAHNSLIYRTLAEKSDLQGLVQFLDWDNVQPVFFKYLEGWLPKTPDLIKKVLEDHIKVEVDEEHSRLFKEMLELLHQRVPSSTKINYEKLENLNYTFSEKAAQNESYGFFLGGFYATEVMSAKRSQNILDGLLRLGFEKTALPYLTIHCEADTHHSQEVLDLLIAPVLKKFPEIAAEIQRGLMDRLNRSGSYLLWYERQFLGT